MRGTAAALAVLALIGATACSADSHEELVKQASTLPPQDTLAGMLAPAVSDASGGSYATPPAPGAPAGGVSVAPGPRTPGSEPAAGAPGTPARTGAASAAATGTTASAGKVSGRPTPSRPAPPHRP